MIKISVVTVTYNAVETIRSTLESVLKQDYGRLEYIIMDGGSSDDTLEVAQSYKKKFEDKQIAFKVISQKDNGIFDAMNKSLDYVTGMFVLFLNAGDFLTSNTVISDVFSSHSVDSFDVVYCDYYAYSKGFRKKYISKNAEELPKRMICTHQAIFTKADLLRIRKYNTNYSMTADYDFYLSMFLDGKCFHKSDVTLVYFDISGISQKKAKITQIERIKLLKEHSCINDIEYKKLGKKVFWICLRKKIISILPSVIRFKSYEKIDF